MLTFTRARGERMPLDPFDCVSERSLTSHQSGGNPISTATQPGFMLSADSGSSGRSFRAITIANGIWFRLAWAGYARELCLSVVVGVGHNERPVSGVCRADGGSRYAIPDCIIPALGQPPENSVDSANKEGCDVLDDHDSRS